MDHAGLWLRNYVLGFSATIFLVLFTLNQAGAEAISFDTPQGNIEFHIERAETQEQQERGLMHRQWMHKDAGMLFIYMDEPKLRFFWMKNTHIPLDIIFIDKNGIVVHVAEDTVPYSEEIIPSVYPAKAALEINAGLASKNGIVPGLKARHSMFEN